MLSLREAMNQLLEGSFIRPGTFTFTAGGTGGYAFPVNVYQVGEELKVEALPARASTTTSCLPWPLACGERGARVTKATSSTIATTAAASLPPTASGAAERKERSMHGHAEVGVRPAQPGDYGAVWGLLARQAGVAPGRGTYTRRNHAITLGARVAP